MITDMKQERERFLEAAERRLSAADIELLHMLNQFTDARLSMASQQAENARRQAGSAAVLSETQAHLHAFLTESWDALDGLAREINLCMYRLYPELGLYAPSRMTRQCGMYMVRKILRESPLMRDHPISQLLWERTRTRPTAAYRRLSFLYNLSVFVPVPVPRGSRLPGTDDVPETLQPLLKDPPLKGCPLGQGLDEMERWLGDLVGTTYNLLSDVLREEYEKGGDSEL